MLKIVTAILIVGCLTFLTTSVASAAIPVAVPGADRTPGFHDYLIKIYLGLTPKKYQRLTGKNLSLVQKIALRLSQQKIRRMIRRGEPISFTVIRKGIDMSDFNALGFLLGLLLPVIGLLIAYLVGDDLMIKWAWIGTALAAAIILLLVLLFA